jgi:hypothetical protein
MKVITIVLVGTVQQTVSTAKVKDDLCPMLRNWKPATFSTTETKIKGTIIAKVLCFNI